MSRRQPRKGYLYEPLKSSEEESNVHSSSSAVVKADDDCENRLVDLSWCKCGHCQLMSSVMENQCCTENSVAANELQDCSCVTQLAKFSKLCLDKDVLKLLMCSINEIIGENVDEITNR